MSTNAHRNEYRFHGVTMPRGTHPDIRRLKRANHDASIHGNKLWRSSFILIDYLQKNRPEHHTTVLDVGCGWGISGIYCARKLGAKVTAVDADDAVFPYLQVVAEANKVEIETLMSRFERLTTQQLSRFDMLIAADICFWDELVKPVCNLLTRAVNAGVKHIIIADPERPPFFEVAERCSDKYCAELLEWYTDKPLPSRGSLLVIENA